MNEWTPAIIDGTLLLTILALVPLAWRWARG